jgi:PleD family two-component response regulator
MDDLLFLSKIQSVAKTLQIDVRPFIGSTEDLTSRISQLNPSSILIDLNSKRIDALGLIISFKASGATSEVPLIGFLSHIDVEMRAAAVSAGCDRVFPRSVFIQNLSEILSNS